MDYFVNWELKDIKVSYRAESGILVPISFNASTFQSDALVKGGDRGCGSMDQAGVVGEGMVTRLMSHTRSERMGLAFASLVCSYE